MVRDTPLSQDVSTHQIWNSYLKEYRRYGPDTKAGRTDGRTVRLLYAAQSSFGGIKINSHQNLISWCCFTCNSTIFAVLSRWSPIFLVWIITKQKIKYLAQEQNSAYGKSGSRGVSTSSLSLPLCSSYTKTRVWVSISGANVILIL